MSVDADMCSTGSGTDSTACPAIADSNGLIACPPVTADGACLSGGNTLSMLTSTVTNSLA